MVIGVDVGYSHTKSCVNGKVDIFKSTVKEGKVDLNKSIQVEFEGKEYTIGEDGLISTNLNKINDPKFRLCLYTAIARNIKVNNECIELVTGLPVQYYASQKEELRQSVEGKTINITVNGEPKRFTIVRCLVFPQSSGLFILEPDKFKGNNMVIDIGGFTVDVSFFNGVNLRKFKTYELGMNSLYDTLVQNIKTDFSVAYDPLEAEEIINTKEIVKDNKPVNCSDTVERTLKAHAELILNRVQNGLTEFNTSKLHFIGGGAYALRNHLPIKDIKKEDIYTNAKAFYYVGVDKFEG